MTERVRITRRALLAGVGALAARAAAPSPNIVFILADDLGWGDLGCYNPESKIRTPNLDRLAAQGVRFTDAHTPSSVCTPTRYGLLTGRYAWRTRLERGVLDGFDPPLIEPGRLTAARLLQQRGYTTGCVGKWHLGMQWTNRDGSTVPIRGPVGFRPGYEVDYTRAATGGPEAAGFDWHFGISASLDMPPYCFLENGRTVGIPDVRTEDDRSLFMNQPPGVRTRDFRLEDVLPTCAARAAGFIRKQKGAGKPFFLYLPLSAPHLPVAPSRAFQGRSQAGLYGDFVEEMDAAVGTVLDALRDSGFEQNTLVFFSSDNGGLWHWWEHRETDDVRQGKITPRGAYVKERSHQSNAWMRGTKSDVWEGGHRVPLIARWPGKIKPGGVSGSLACLTDFLATCAEVVGAPLPRDAGEDSFSLLPALLDPARQVRDHVVHHSGNGHFALRQGEWKYAPVRGSGGFSTPRTVAARAGEPEGQLYNIKLDRAETTNLYAARPEVAARLSALLERCRREGRTRP